jgi:hypothetical protein
VSKKFKKQARSENLAGIRPTKLTPEGVAFSFKYLDANHAKFAYRGQSINYWTTLLDRLKALSELTALELIRNRSQALRCHPIDWATTSEPGFGIPAEAQLVQIPYQFSLSSNEHGRIHGFFIEETFYIVWLDPHHLLYESR